MLKRDEKYMDKLSVEDDSTQLKQLLDSEFCQKIRMGDEWKNKNIIRVCELDTWLNDILN